MKALSFALLLMACMAFVLLGCSDSSAPVVTPRGVGDNTAPSLGKTDGPGAWVFKYGFDTWFGWVDPSAGWMLIIGVNDLSLACRGQGGLDWFSINDIYLPNADPDLRRNVYQLFGHDVAALAWRATSWPEDVCAFAAEHPPDAVGLAKLINTDNDYYAPYQDNQNANAWGYKATGALTGSDGQVYILNLVRRISWDGVDGTRRNTVFKIQLTPTGGH